MMMTMTMRNTISFAVVAVLVLCRAAVPAQGRELFIRGSFGQDASTGTGTGSTGCPEPASVPCPRNYLLVRCGDGACEYSNLCIARAAGYDPIECVAVETCPDPAPDQPCTYNIMPVWCEGACVYDNISCAQAAGYKESQCQTIPP